MCEQYHCEDGWLPTDGTLDVIIPPPADLRDRGFDHQVDYLLLIPTDYTVCSCNPIWTGIEEEIYV